MKILFVCQANVGRSQMAKLIFNKLAGGNHIATSAGIKVIDKATGKNCEGQAIKDVPAAENALRVLKEIGIDAGEQTRHQVTAEDAARADMVVVMVDPKTIPEFLSKHKNIVFWIVEDPFEQSLEFTRQIRDQIQMLVAGLLKKIQL